MRGMSSADDFRDFYVNRDVAQLVARTAGGREVASSSLVIPTIQIFSSSAIEQLHIQQTCLLTQSFATSLGSICYLSNFVL